MRSTDGFLKKFSGLADGRTADTGDPFCQEIRFARATKSELNQFVAHAG